MATCVASFALNDDIFKRQSYWVLEDFCLRTHSVCNIFSDMIKVLNDGPLCGSNHFLNWRPDWDLFADGSHVLAIRGNFVLRVEAVCRLPTRSSEQQNNGKIINYTYVTSRRKSAPPQM